MILMAAALAVGACDDEAEMEEVVRPIRAMRILDADAMQGRSFPCRAEAVEKVNVAFEAPGRLVERPVRVGSDVDAGMLLARLDLADFENELAQAKARAGHAQSLRDRMARARESGAVAEQDLTDAQAELDGANAEVAIRANALADSQLRAPFDSIIASTYVENFQNVQAKQPVMRHQGDKVLRDIDDALDAGDVQQPHDENIKVTFDAFPDTSVPAAISEIGREASETTRTFPITLVMGQPEGIEILPGMAGRALGQVVLPDDPAGGGYDVPLNAISSDDGKRNLVWVIDETSLTASKREIEKLGATPTGMRVHGVEKGEWVATTAVHVLREGQRVRLPALERERGQ